MVDRLLAAGADADALTNDHWTPLHESALNGHETAVERLVRAGAQVWRCLQSVVCRMAHAACSFIVAHRCSQPKFHSLLV